MRRASRDIDGFLFRQRPGQIDQPVEIVAYHAGFGGGFRHPLVAAQFLARLAFRLRRHLGLGDGLVQFGDFLGLAVAFAELALDRRHLLAQDRLALALVEGGFCLLADFVGQPQHLKALGEIARDLLHPGREIDRLQDLLLLLRLDIHVGGREIGESARGGRRLQRRDQLRRRLRQQLNRFDGLPLQVQKMRLDLR